MQIKFVKKWVFGISWLDFNEEIFTFITPHCKNTWNAQWKWDTLEESIQSLIEQCNKADIESLRFSTGQKPYIIPFWERKEYQKFLLSWNEKDLP